MSHVFLLLISCLVISSLPAHAQRKWDGGGGNNLWSNALNWVGNTVPSSSEEVELDNSIITSNYTVLLPSSTVSVRRITISPALSRRIELNLPSTNTLSPGLSIAGPGYGMILNAGGVFRNSSGATSGVAVVVSDSIRINNGGQYIHNTRSGHSSNVQVLSRSPGTETGIFELDMPSASTTISVSGRTFGSLLIRSVAAGGSCNYTAAGTSRVTIRGNLDLGSGVTLNLNCSDTIEVQGNFIQAAGTLNLGNSSRSVALVVKQNFTQAIGGVITETGTGLQSIVMAGTGVQLMTARGSWLNQVAFVKTDAGPVLMKTALSLPYKLKLQEGVIVTSDTWLLTLQASCAIEADSLATTGHVNGPLKKEGLTNSSFLFPVGDLTRLRWLRVENATGSFTVQYVKSDPRNLSNTYGSGLHHISSIEYWSIAGNTGNTAVVKLSFIDPHSGGVTDLASLRVARLSDGTWQNAGSTSYSGSPGWNGWVSSTSAGGFSANKSSFALASAISQENPLPFTHLSLEAKLLNRSLMLSWQAQGHEDQPRVFEVQYSQDGETFYTLRNVIADTYTSSYRISLNATNIARFYRVRMKYVHSDKWYESAVASVRGVPQSGVTLLSASVINQSVDLILNVPYSDVVSLELYDVGGIHRASKRASVKAGMTSMSVDMSRELPGIYIMVVRIGSGERRIYRLLKR